MKNIIKSLFGMDADSNNKKNVRSFDEKQAQEEAFERIDRGLRTVDLDKIIGSVGRYHDFDGRFRLKKHMPHERLKGIKDAMRSGKSLPPIKLYQIKDEYYVVDGNHRVAAAKELGRFDINAKIIELIASKNTLENLLYREKLDFCEKTGLTDKINLTEAGKYFYLEKQIKKHQRALKRNGKVDMTFQDASKDWYDTIYTPLTAIIEKGNLLKYFPDRSLTDLYAYISFHQWEPRTKRKYGIGIDRLIPGSMGAFRKKMMNKTKPEYPEMQRRIIAFVMINVNTRTEAKIIEKLYSLEEIQEVHSVHGNIDILVKAVLKRDFMASDAEIIAEFVDQRIRRISGIASTQTIIPGISKVKEDPLFG